MYNHKMTHAVPQETPFDRIGRWSEVKLDIVQAYAQEYATIMDGRNFETYYIDAFCGPGMHISKDTQEGILGSPLRVLNLPKTFQKYYFIDLEGKKIEHLRKICRKFFPQLDIQLEKGDCNCVLAQLLPKLHYNKFHRLLCFLDPYGLHLQWDIIKTMGQNGISDIVLNFPIMDANRNVLWKKEIADGESVNRLNAFWGDESWREVVYETRPTLFGDESQKRDDANSIVADAFGQRLRNEAGFKYVADPIPLKNSTGATVYYLFFASQKEVANKIASYIFKKYGEGK